LVSQSLKDLQKNNKQNQQVKFIHLMHKKTVESIIIVITHMYMMILLDMTKLIQKKGWWGLLSYKQMECTLYLLKDNSLHVMLLQWNNLFKDKVLMINSLKLKISKKLFLKQIKELVRKVKILKFHSLSFLNLTLFMMNP